MNRNIDHREYRYRLVLMVSMLLVWSRTVTPLNMLHLIGSDWEIYTFYNCLFLLFCTYSMKGFFSKHNVDAGGGDVITFTFLDHDGGKRLEPAGRWLGIQ